MNSVLHKLMLCMIPYLPALYQHTETHRRRRHFIFVFTELSLIIQYLCHILYFLECKMALLYSLQLSGTYIYRLYFTL